MYKPLIAAVLVLVLSSSVVAAGGPGPSTERETLTVEIERQFAELLGLTDVEPVVRRHEDDLVSYSYSLRRQNRDRLLDKAGVAAKKLVLLANGHKISPATDPAALVNAVASDTGVNYIWWWCAVNTTSDFVLADTSNQIKGPGLNFRQNDSETFYDPDALICYTSSFDVVFPRSGIYTHKTRVTKAGTIKTKTLAKAPVN